MPLLGGGHPQFHAPLLSGDQVVTARRGDLVAVPPNVPHAFAAAPGESADILIVITRG